MESLWWKNGPCKPRTSAGVPDARDFRVTGWKSGVSEANE
jgi:hypothetical protein